MEIVRTMVEAGVDLMELQIPFSEPIADGPVILKANQQALANGVTVEQCLDFGRQVARQFPIPFLYMTYYNILFKYGVDRFADGMQGGGTRGHRTGPAAGRGRDYLDAMGRHELAPIFIYSPTTSMRA
jgi:tryptophan synthase alpha chain